MDLLGAPLRGFLTIARLGSVSAAANSLGLTQPAVTKQVRVLWRQERKPTFAMQSFLAIVVGSALPGARATAEHRGRR
jgi:hypothetical protein